MRRYIDTNNLGNVLCSPLKQNMFEHDSMADLDIPHSIINLSEDNECKPILLISKIALFKNNENGG